LKGFVIKVVDAKFQVITAIRMKSNAFEMVVTIYQPAGCRIPEGMNIQTLHMLTTIIFHVPYYLFLDVVKVKLFVFTPRRRIGGAGIQLRPFLALEVDGSH
jgi:hypothetical protein